MLSPLPTRSLSAIRPWLVSRRLATTLPVSPSTYKMGEPKILSSEELPTTEAKWITLKKIHWEDQDGKKRVWEAAERKTRSKGGIDAVAILAIIRSKSNAFKPSTVIIEQYRPPIGATIIELPAGLIDEGESPEEAAVRELHEETGFKVDEVIHSSPVIVSDPGMTTANMKLVTVSVSFEGQLETPIQKLEEGEHIVKRVVPLDELNAELNAYANKGFVVDARLQHIAHGYEMAIKLKDGSL